MLEETSPLVEQQFDPDGGLSFFPHEMSGAENSGLTNARKQPPRFAEMRDIEHLALIIDDTRMRLGREGGDDGAGLGDGFLPRAKKLR